MKTKSKRSSKQASITARQKNGRVPRTKADSPRKSIENRDLNGEEGQRTNASREEEWDINKEDSQAVVSDTSVEEEQDREAKRKLEDSNADELLT